MPRSYSFLCLFFLLIPAIMPLKAGNLFAAKNKNKLNTRMLAVHLGYATREGNDDDKKLWPDAFVMSFDFNGMERESNRAWTLTTTYSRYSFGGEKVTGTNKPVNWMITVGPSYMVRTPDRLLPANLRFYFMPHIGFGLQRLSREKPSSIYFRKAKSKGVALTTLALGLQVEPVKNWNVGFQYDRYIYIVHVYAECYGIHRYSGGFSFYF